MEMSSMSEMSVVSTADKPGGQDENDNIFKVGYIIILVLFALIGAVYFTRGSDDMIATVDDSGDDGGSDGGSGGEGGKPPSIVVNDPTTATTRFVPKTTTTEGTTSPTPDTFTEPVSTPRPTPKPLNSTFEDIILCTISHRAIWEQSYPADGLCDQIYYTEIRYYSAISGFAGAYDDRSFDLFKKKVKEAGSGARTSYGASFRYAEGASAAVYVSKLDSLLNIGIHNYGLLKVTDDLQNLTQSNANLEILKEVKKKQDALRSKRLRHRVFGFQGKNRDHIDMTRNVTAYVARNYPITILITVTHTLEIIQWSEGPSSWETSHAPYSMKPIADEWKAMAKNDNLWILGSYTMAAQMWKTANNTNYNNYTDGWWRVIWWSPTIYEQTCIEGGGELDEKGRYMFKGNWDAKLLTTWDTRDSMLQKLQDFFIKLDVLPKRHGWALYDVDYDDPHNRCKPTSFARLIHISRYLRL